MPLFKDIPFLSQLSLSWDADRHTNIAFTPGRQVYGTVSIIRHGRANIVAYGENGSPSDLLTFKFVPGTTLAEKSLIKREIEIMERLVHPRILRLLTSKLEGDFALFITPFAKYGNILQYLTVSPAADILNLMIDVAEGLQYLHNDVLIVHGDLRSGKILVSESGRALITGFALSRDILSSLPTIPSPWASVPAARTSKPKTCFCPELMGPDPVRTTAFDIYAFGTLIVEAATGGVLLMECRTLENMGHCPLPGKRGEALYHLAHLCRDWEPHKRPQIAAVRRKLSDIERETNASPDPEKEEVSHSNRGNPVGPSSMIYTGPFAPWSHSSMPPPPPRSILRRVREPVSSTSPVTSPVIPTTLPHGPMTDHVGPPVTSGSPGAQEVSAVARQESVSVSARSPDSVSHKRDANESSRILDRPGLDRPPTERFPSSHYPETLTFVHENTSLKPRGMKLCYDGPLSRVWRATVEIGGKELNVAVKILHTETFSPESPTPQQTFDRELRTWQKLRHRNILPLLAPNSELCAFLSPFMQEGTLLDYLEAHEGTADPLLLMCDVAEGLSYLHMTVGVVHGDIKPSNIFVTDHGRAVLGDFGLSTTIAPGSEVTEYSVRSLFTVTYCAPERLADKAVYPSQPQRLRSKTSMTDVYSFGLVLYQACGGVLPTGGPSGNMGFCIQMTKGIFPDKLVPNRRAPRFCDEIWEHCVCCWSTDPERRPVIDALLGGLKGLLRASPTQSTPEHEAGSFPGGLPPLALPAPDPALASGGSAALDVPRDENAAGFPGPSLAQRLAKAREVFMRWFHIAAYLSLFYLVGYWIMMIVY